MSITGGTFAVFLLVVLVVYYLLPRRAQNIWLLLASLAFYVTWAQALALALAVMIAVNFLLAQRMVTLERTPRRRLMWVGIVFNLMVVLVFKYFDFFVPDFQALVARVAPLDTPWISSLRIFLPIGLSYRQLEMISYLVEVNRKQVKPATDPVDFSLFATWFPKLLAGPIERYRTFMPRLQEARRVDGKQFARGVTLILIGLVRKLILADILLIVIPETLFATPAAFSAGDLFWWGLASGIYLYNDFAGYSAYVRGVSALFGLEMMQNFRTPMFSRTFAEVWSNWHISLSSWIRDYIYLPMTRSLIKQFKKTGAALAQVIPSAAAWMVSAVWHGLTAPFLLWGALMGSLQILENVPALAGIEVKPMKQRPLWRQVIGNFWVIAIGGMATLPFLLDVPTSVAVWRRLLTPTWGLPDIRVVLFIAATYGLDYFRFHYGEAFPVEMPRWAQVGALGSVLLVLFVVTITDFDTPSFVYQGF
ncbi:MAG: MBOAT family protein [Chloroflexi bacterium]|nr:MBOAT family protein [Chloroflexota bacterium]